jgi:hypothetical protein
MDYYHGIITEKSFQFLQRLKRDYQFILIGGWAVFLYSHALKSKDIDIIVDYAELGKIRDAQDVAKNDRLKKYEVKTGEFDVDIYVPHYSELGIDIEEIKKSAVAKEGFTVPALEVLFLLKLFAHGARLGSAKGQKDEMDIFSLVALPEFDWERYRTLVRELKLEALHEGFLKLLAGTASVPELGLNEQKFARKKREITEKLQA